MHPVDISEAEDDDSDLRAGTTPAPLSTAAAFAIAHQSYRWGFLNVCIVLVLAFHRLRRTSEFFSLRAAQFVYGNHTHEAHIIFQQMKASQLNSILESVHVNDFNAPRHITRYLNPGDPFLLMSPRQFSIGLQAGVHVLKTWWRGQVSGAPLC